LRPKSNVRYYWIFAVVVLAGCALASCWGRNGMSEASAARYAYLPDSLNADADVSVAEFAAVRFTAYYNCPGNLTSRLMRQSARCFLGTNSIDLFIDTVTQAYWNTHVAGSRFSVGDDQVIRAYAEAGDVAMDWLRRFFPGVDDRNMRIIFSIKGYQIGVYSCGEFVISR